jgi:hypothetical protein
MMSTAARRRARIVWHTRRLTTRARVCGRTGHDLCRSEQEFAAAEEIRAETGAEVLTVSADLTTLPPSYPEDPPA